MHRRPGEMRGHEAYHIRQTCGTWLDPAAAVPKPVCLLPHTQRDVHCGAQPACLLTRCGPPICNVGRTNRPWGRAQASSGSVSTRRQARGRVLMHRGRQSRPTDTLLSVCRGRRLDGPATADPVNASKRAPIKQTIPALTEASNFYAHHVHTDTPTLQCSGTCTRQLSHLPLRRWRVTPL